MVSLYNEGEQAREAQRREMIVALASLLHEKWRVARGFEPRLKTVLDEEWITSHNGQTEIDIANTPFAELPGDWQEENILSAKEAVEKIEDALYHIHDMWLDRNDTSASEEQKTQYSKLPKEEKLKDIAVLKEAIDVFIEKL